jgi:hypothetical protein
MTYQPKRTGPYAGYDSLEEAVEGLRRARFRVASTFRVERRGLVVEGDILEGAVRVGMVLLPVLERYDNIYTPLTIDSVEFVRQTGGAETIALVIGTPPPEQPNLASGTIVDVLERAPGGLTSA